jgi:hypothetical protein
VSERDFWLGIRRALLQIVGLIEKRYDVGAPPANRR